MLSRMNKSSKLNIYSGHDDTVISLLVSLGIWDGVWPPYASMFIIEVSMFETNI